MKDEGVATDTVSYALDYIDQVNEGCLVVWALYEDWIGTEAQAREAAAEYSARHEYKTVRVYRVKRELVATYYDGKEET